MLIAIADIYHTHLLMNHITFISRVQHTPAWWIRLKTLLSRLRFWMFF